MKTNRGGWASNGKPERVAFVGLAVLAVAAVWVAALALAPRPPEGAFPAPSGVASLTVDPSTVDPSPSPSASPTPTAPVTPKFELPENPRVLIVGDSYTAGWGAETESEGWAHVAGSLMSPAVMIDGIPGTGFAWGGGASNEQGDQFSVRLQSIAAEQTFTPDVLVLQGGQNDVLLRDDARVTAAVAATVSEARELWPGIKVVIMGPSAPEPLASTLKQTNAAVSAGATAAGVPFIDASGEHWFTAENSGSFYTDGAHVNAAGHNLIAERFISHWRELTQ